MFGYCDKLPLSPFPNSVTTSDFYPICSVSTALSHNFCSFSGNFYGTSAAAVGAVIREQTKVCLIDIKLECVFEVRSYYCGVRFG